MPLLELRGITRRFGSVLANDAIGLSLAAGAVHGLLGENGAGKSTLARIISGADQQDAGDIRLDGRTVALRSPADAAAQGIGAVQQHTLMVPTLTVAENLLLGGRWHHRPRRAAAAQRFAADCATFGLAIDPAATAGALSLAEQRQVEIIRALWRGSRLLVLDEPTAMLGPAASAQLLAIMQALRRRGVAVVFVTHSLDEARAAADRIFVLRRGKLVGDLAPDAPAERVRGLMFGDAQGSGTGPPVAATPSWPDSIRPSTQSGGHAASRSGEPATDIVAGGWPLVDGRIKSGHGATPVLSVTLPGIVFTVAAGEILGIAGIEGNGQRELAETLAGQRAADGRIVLDGRDVTARGVAARHRLGLRHLSDDRLGEGSVGGFSVAINLLLKQIGTPPFWHHGIAQRPAMAEHAERLIAAYDVRTPGPWTAIRSLSGGNIQKAMLARELDGAPRLIVLHKPTIGLDLQNAAAIRRRIADAADAGVATVVISADLDELVALADRIGVLAAGRLAGIVPRGPGAPAQVAALMTGGP